MRRSIELFENPNALRRRRSPSLARLLLALVAISLAPAAIGAGNQAGVAAGPPPAEGSVVATMGRWAAILTRAGRIATLDLESGARHEWAPPARFVRALAIDPSATASGTTAPALVVAAGAETSGASTIFSVRFESGETLGRVSIDVDAAFLLPSPGAEKIHVIGRRGDRWAIASLDLAKTGASEGPFTLPAPVGGAALSADGSRIYLSSEDGIRTFSTGPLRSSWLLRSPGPNGDLLAMPSGGGLLAARGRRLALFDPRHPPGRDPVTGAFPIDDALRLVALPFEAGGIAIQADERLASVLSADGARLAVADLAGGSLVEVREIAPAAACAFLADPGRLLLIDLEGASVVKLPIDFPPAEPPKIASAPPAQAPLSRPPSSSPDNGASPPPAPAAEAPPPAPAPASEAPPSAARPGVISGRITGEIALVQSIVLFGPSSIFREHLRVAPTVDGTYEIPLPPPGRYRILLRGARSAQLSYTPAYYQISVMESAIGGLDFNVAGRIEGRLKP